MVWVDTHAVILQVKGILAEFDMLEFILVEVRPAPQTCINHMRKTLPSCHLQPSIQRPLDGNTLAGMHTIGGNGSDE